MCGLVIELDDQEIHSIKPNHDDVFSRGHICPKAIALQDLHNDPDRLRKPVKRIGSNWIEISWDEALEEVATNLFDYQTNYSADAVGYYIGNPTAHNYGNLTHVGYLFAQLKTRNRYSVSTADEAPHRAVHRHMYGHEFIAPVVDLDRTDHWLVLGANPLVSNGSLMTAPGMPRRLKSMRQRGAKLVVIDPRRTETAAVADEFHFIRPGSDAALLLAMLNHLFTQNLINIGRLDSHIEGLDTVAKEILAITPERAARATGISAQSIKRLAEDLVAAKTAAVYGRFGVSTQQFGGICQWAIHLLNLVTGNLDRVGGVLCNLPALDLAAFPSLKGHRDKWRSRVSQVPEVGGELPGSVLAEEILTEGEDQLRCLLTIAGNPVLSNANGRQLETALEKLDFMASIDFYINETTRFANIILPPTGHLEHDHYDLAFSMLAVRNITKYSEPVFDKPEGTLHDWEILTALATRLASKNGVDVRAALGHARPGGGPMVSAQRMLDFGIQTGPYGKRARHPLALTLNKLKENPHGIDLGPLQPSFPERLQTANKKIHCAPDIFVQDLQRVETELLTGPPTQSLLLIGRRDARTNNSWLHNSYRMVKGKERCFLLMNHTDMLARQLNDGDIVTVISRVGSINVSAHGTDNLMPGVVSLPHGWGHTRTGIKLGIASNHAGVSINDLTDEKMFDQTTGTSVLNGVPVSVSASG